MDISDIKIIIFVIVVIGGIMMGLVLPGRRKKSWLKAFKELAQFAGLSLRPNFTPAGDLEKLEVFTRKGWKYGAYNVIDGKWQSRPVMALKYVYETRGDLNSVRSKMVYYVIHARLLNVDLPEFLLDKVKKGTYFTDARLLTNHPEMDRLYGIGIDPDREEERERLRGLFSQPVIDVLLSRELKGDFFIQASGKQAAMIFLDTYMKPGELNVIFSNFMEFIKAIDAPDQTM